MTDPDLADQLSEYLTDGEYTMSLRSFSVHLR